MQFVTILGRQPELSLAELEARFSSDAVTSVSESAALVETDALDIETLGGSIKAGKVVFESDETSWAHLSKKIVRHYTDAWRNKSGKQTLGISAYDLSVSPREIQATALALKKSLKSAGPNLRIIPNQEVALSSATSHHNKLGLSNNKTELLIVRSKTSVFVAESVGAQNITALAARDQSRPKTDAFVGMLPPKLALMMVNMAGLLSERNVDSEASSFPPGAKQDQSVVSAERADESAFQSDEAVSKKTNQETVDLRSLESRSSGKPVFEKSEQNTKTILDPFCGTGVILQEASLRGFDVYGTDLSEKMIDYSTQNLDWLKNKFHLENTVTIHHGDALETKWNQKIDAIVAETYLGQPFSAPPSPNKLAEVRRLCDYLLETFLQNLAPQLEKGTSLVLAVPAWRDKSGRFTFLDLADKIETLGFAFRKFETVNSHELLYARETQVVARQLLLLEKR